MRACVCTCPTRAHESPTSRGLQTQRLACGRENKSPFGPPAFVLGEGEICNRTLSERRHSVSQVRPLSQHAPMAGWPAGGCPGVQPQAPLPRQQLFLSRNPSSSPSLNVSTWWGGGGESSPALSGPRKGREMTCPGRGRSVSRAWASKFPGQCNGSQMRLSGIKGDDACKDAV